MTHSHTRLTLVSLALGLFVTQAFAQKLEINPPSFLANKPIHATLHLNQVSENTTIRILPGGAYKKTSLDFKSAITISKTANGHRYTAHENRGIEITNLLDQEIATRNIGEEGSTYRAIDINDEFLLAVTKAGSAQIFSLANENSEPSGYYDTYANIVQAQLEQQYAYLLTDTGTLYILDISNPEWPLLAGEYYGSPDSKRFTVHQGLIWLAAGKQGLVVLDTANPLDLQKVSTYKTNQPALDISLNNDTALVTTGAGGLTLLNTSDPRHIVWLGSHSKLGYTQHVAVNSQFQAIVSNNQNDLYHLDFSVPSQPTIINAFRSEDRVQQLVLHEQELTLISKHSIALWDVSAEQPLVSNENLNMGEGVNFGGQRKGFIENDTLYVADWFSGIHIYDIRQGQNPRLLSSYHTPGSPKGVVVKDGIAYIADDDHGLQLVDVSDPTNPQAVSSILTKGLAYTPIIEGNLLYLASHHGGFQIIDIEDVFQPKLLGEYNTPSKSWSIAVKNKTAYVADAESGLLVFDVQNPSEPKLIGNFDPNGNAEDVIIDDDLAYVAFFDKGIYILDISNPTQPRSLGHLTTPGNARGLDLQGFVLYVADWLGGMHAINIANPEQPKLIGSYDSQGAVWGLLTQGIFTYIFDWWGGLSVLDVKHPSDIHKVGDYNQRTPIDQLKAQGNFLYAAQGHRGLQVYDIKNPLNPTWVTGLEIQNNVVDISLQDTYIYAAAEEGGLAIFDISNPYSPQLTAQQQTIEPLVRIKTLGSVAYGQNRLGNIIGFDISQATQPQQTFNIKQSFSDYHVNEHYLISSQGQQLARFNLDQGIPNDTAKVLVLAHDIKLIRLKGHIAYVFDQNNTLHIVDLNNDEPQLLTTTPFKQNIVDALLDGSQLHITDKLSGVSTYLIEKNYEFTAITHYPLLSHISGVYAYRDQLYGIGENFILAINKLPNIKLTNTEDAKTTTLSIEAGLANGSYDILVDSNEQTKHYTNALTTAYFGIPANKEAPPAISTPEVQEVQEVQEQGETITPEKSN